MLKTFKTLSKRIFFAAALASTSLLASSCQILNIPGCSPYFYLQLSNQAITVNQRVPMTVNVNNPCNADLEYRFVAQRGAVVAQNPLLPQAEYTAPYSGGEDTITVSVYNRSTQSNLPQQSLRVLVVGDGMSYVEGPAPGTVLGDNDNGVIKVASIQGVGIGQVPRQVALGRQPVISPDGRYLAYTYYPGDGSSQVRVQDAVGNVQIMTGTGGAFNRDPAWAPIGSDQSYHLVFSSDRVDANGGERGADYNIWRVTVPGQNLQQLASTPGNDQEPTWSPDAQTIIYRSQFSQNQVQNFSNLWRLELSSGRLLQLTYESVPDKGAYEPEFSPDGGRVVYSRRYLSRQSQLLLNLQKIWVVDLRNIDIPSLLPFDPAKPGSGPVVSPTLPGGVSGRETNFGNIATQEFDETAIELSPSFSVDGRFITFVRHQRDEVRVLSIPSNTGNSGYIGAQPISVLPQGSDRAIEATWARQTRSYSR